MAFLERLQQARNEAAKENADPWSNKVAALVRDMDAISTAALLDLVRAPATTGTARRLAAIMRNLNFIPVKSCRVAGLETHAHAAGLARFAEQDHPQR
jgi:hypothetical protein